MQIGLFFGSFNPIHQGHTRLAEWILRHTCLHEIWMVVSPNNPLKDKATLWDETLRLELVQVATQSANERLTDIRKEIRACDVEFDMPKPNYTYLTLLRLCQMHPEHEFTLLMGGDNLRIFDQWREWHSICCHYPIMVYPRDGQEVVFPEQMESSLRLRFTVLHGAPLFDISATEIRTKIYAGEHSIEWLDPKVEEIIKKNAQIFAYIKKKQ